MSENENGEKSKITPVLVKLNVGGYKYITTLTTLYSHSAPNFLTVMIENDAEERIPCLRDELGYIFIDRNGLVFSVILEFFRTGKIIIPPNVTREQIEIEFDFFQLTPPERLTIKPKTSPLQKVLNAWEEKSKIFFDLIYKDVSQTIITAAKEGKSGIQILLKPNTSQNLQDEPDTQMIGEFLLVGQQHWELFGKDLFQQALCNQFSNTFNCKCSLRITHGSSYPKTIILQWPILSVTKNTSSELQALASCVRQYPTPHLRVHQS